VETQTEIKGGIVMLNYWPFAAKAKDGVVGFIIALIIFVVIGAVGGWIIGFLTGLVPKLLAWVLGIAGSIISLYCFIGLVLSILVFLGIVKK
jgi:hypothetical protein